MGDGRCYVVSLGVGVLGEDVPGSLNPLVVATSDDDLFKALGLALHVALQSVTFHFGADTEDFPVVRSGTARRSRRVVGSLAHPDMRVDGARAVLAIWDMERLDSGLFYVDAQDGSVYRCLFSALHSALSGLIDDWRGDA